MERIYGLTETDRTRTREAILAEENRRAQELDPNSPVISGPQAVVIRLTTTLELGRHGLGFIVSLRMPLQDSKPPITDTDWMIESNDEVEVHLVGGQYLRYDPGAMVAAVPSGNGYIVVSGSLMGWIGGFTPVPYGVYRIDDSAESNFSSSYLSVSGALKLSESNYASVPYNEDWAGHFAFLGRASTELPTAQRVPARGVTSKGDAAGGANLTRLYPCTVQLPAWVAYSQEANSNLPADVLEALGWDVDGHPSKGDIWGPLNGDAYLHRTAAIMELYWWEWFTDSQNLTVVVTLDSGTGAWDMIFPPGMWGADGTDPIEDTATASIIQGQIEAVVGSGNVTVTGDVGGPFTIEFIGQLAGPTTLSPAVRNQQGDLVVILTTVQEGHAEERRQWIAPDGWWNSWGWGGWGWNGQGAQGWYTALANNSHLWGSWCYGWWRGRWGRFAPRSDDIDISGVVPTPPTGTVTKYCIYGYVVWRYGWRILQVDQDRELALIGPHNQIEFRDSLVVVNDEITDCPAYTPGTDPPL